jgi:nicotinamidase-related amidase
LPQTVNSTAAGNRDYVAIVIEDCVQTMDGPELHDAGLRRIETAFSWVMDEKQALAAVAE